jgi:hypothetical protein
MLNVRLQFASHISTGFRKSCRYNEPLAVAIKGIGTEIFIGRQHWSGIDLLWEIFGQRGGINSSEKTDRAASYCVDANRFLQAAAATIFLYSMHRIALAKFSNSKNHPSQNESRN